MIKIHIVSLLLLFHIHLFADQNYQRILSDIANVRNVPKQSGSIIARLVNGTTIVCVDSLSDWCKIDFNPSPSQSSINKQPRLGWVHRSTLTPKFISPYSGNSSTISLYDEFQHAKNLADSILWLERLWTNKDRNGADTMVKNKLITCYQHAGDTARLAWIENQPSIYLVKGNNNTLRLLGTIDSKGEFFSLIWPVRSKKTLESEGDKELARLADWIHLPANSSVASVKKWLTQVDKVRLEIAALRWHGVRNGGTEYFPCPFFTPTGNSAVNDKMDLPVYFDGALGALILDTVTYQPDGLLYCSRNTSLVPINGPKMGKNWPLIADRITKLTSGIKTGIETDDMGSNYGITNVRAWFLPESTLDLTVEAPFEYSGVLFSQYARGIFNPAGDLLWPEKYCDGNCRLGKNYFPFKISSVAFTPDDPSPRWFQIEGIVDYSYAILPCISSYFPDEKAPSQSEVLLRLGPEGIKSWEIWSDGDLH